MECIEYHDTHCVNYSTESNHSYCFDEEIQNNSNNEIYNNNNVNDNFTITKPLIIEVSKNQIQDNINTENKALNSTCLDKQTYSINSKVIDITCVCKNEGSPEPNLNNVNEITPINNNTQQQQPPITNSVNNNNDNGSNNIRPSENEEQPISKIFNFKNNKTFHSTHIKAPSVVVKKLPNIDNKRISKVPLIKNILYNRIINQQQNQVHLFHHKIFDNNYNSLLSVENIHKNRAISALTKGVSSKRTTSACSITARDKSNDNKKNNNPHHQLNRIKSATMLLLKDNLSIILNEIKQKPNMNINNHNHILQDQEYQRRNSMKSNLYFNLANFTKMKNVWNVHTLNTNKLKYHKKEYKKRIFGLDNNNNNGKQKDIKENKYVLRKSKSISICREMSVDCKERENMKKDFESQRECINNKREENVNKIKKVSKRKKIC